MGKIALGEKSKVNIKWEVLPIDYSHEKEESIISKFAKKYNISKDNVKVTPKFISINSNGEAVPYTNNISENIQDPKFQQELFKKFLNEKGTADYDFDEIIKIDELINSKINYDLFEPNKHYSIKWIKWNNFMSYGANNYFDFTSLKGLILLTSEPANQGGKTTFCLDLLRFLLFGKVTSRENDWTLAKVFNKHLPEITDVAVEGCVNIDGQDYIIKRTVSRPALKKRTAKSKVSQKINYYKLVNDQYVELYDEECEEENTGRDTNKAIKDAIGNERDFDLMICVDSDNLKGLISLKDTDRGRLLSRWIGLLPLEEKDKIAREMFNKTIMPSLMMNRYNKDGLISQNENLTSENKDQEEKVAKDTKSLEESNQKIEELYNTYKVLVSSKKNIDGSLMKVDVKTIENTIAQIKNNGKIKRNEKNETEKKIEELKEISFDKTIYDSLVKSQTEYTIKLTESRSDYKKIVSDIEMLQKSEFCPTCGARLKNVDNSKAIAEKEAVKAQLIEDGKKLKEELENITAKIKTMDENRYKYEERQKLELLRDKLTVDIENLLNRYKENDRILKDIEVNKAAIEDNNKIDTAVNTLSVTIKTQQTISDNLRKVISEETVTISNNKKVINDNTEIINKITSEEKIVRHWKLYLDLIGKDGITKMVLRTVLPLINGELQQLLSDVCDFTVEVAIDDHNDVAFYMIHDGVYSNLSSGSGFEQTVSSLALRSVLSKISSFSKPSFVVFDEILGGVAEENYDQVKKLYDKIVEDYQCVLQITHLKTISEWHNKTIVIKKENNISTIQSC